MATTTNLALPYPAASDAPDGAGGLYALAKRIDDLALLSAPTFPGTITNMGGNDRSTCKRDGSSSTLNLAVNVGSNGLSQNGVVLAIPDGHQGPSDQNMWFDAAVFDTNNSPAGRANLRVVGSTVTFYAWTANAGATSTTLPANYRLVGGTRYRTAS